MNKNRLSRCLWLVVVLLPFVLASSARASALKALVDRCAKSRDQAQNPEVRKCVPAVKGPGAAAYSKCMKDAGKKGKDAFEGCMNGDGKGKCVLKEFNTPRSGNQGQKDRYGALLKCGYNVQEVNDLGGWVPTN